MFQILKMGCERVDVIGISIDITRNLPLPNTPDQEVFNFRQFWVYLFKIYNFKTQK